MLKSVDRKFSSWLRAQGYGRFTRELLTSITPGAAAASVPQRTGLQKFLLHVESAGLSLSKCNLPPGEIAAALQQYDSLLQASLQRAGSPYAALTLERLHATVILSLGNAYQQVRDAETKAVEKIYEIALEAEDTEKLFERFLEVMSATCGAVEARLFLLSEDTPRNTPVAAPLYIKRGTRQERYLLDSEWRGMYPCYWSIPVLNASSLLGVIQFGFDQDRRWLPREEELLTRAANLCLRAAGKVRLLEDLALRKEEMRQLGEKMLEVEELERRRISRELHDDPGQSLVVIRLQLELLELSIPAGDEEIRGKLAEVRDITEKTILDIRRLISDLSPAILEQLGLAPALRQMVNRLRRDHPARIRLKIGKMSHIPKNLEVVAYRLIQESCKNAVRHSSASDVNISVASAEGILRLQVELDAIDLDAPEEAGDKQAFALPGIRERVALLGGRFSLINGRISNQSGGRSNKRGTILEIELPIPPDK